MACHVPTPGQTNKGTGRLRARAGNLDGVASSAPSSRGTIIVVVLLGAGALAAVAGIRYWNGQPHGEDPARAADARTKAAGIALEKLEQQYGQAQRHKNYDRIIARAREQVGRFVDHAPSHTFLGMVLSEAGRLEEAFEQLRGSLELDPSQAEVHFTCGVLATKLERLPAALEHYRQSISLDADAPIYRVHEAMVHLKMNQLDKARMQLLIALRQDSNLADGYHGLAELYFKQNQLQLALDQIDKAIDRTPIKKRQKQVKYVRKKAWILRHSNRWLDSLQTLDKLTAKERRDHEVLEELATCYRSMGKLEEAAAIWGRALETEPKWIYAEGAARWCIEAGRLADARRYLGTLSVLHPGAPQIKELEERIAKAIEEAAEP